MESDEGIVMTATLFVVGDIGRSPRMCYHAYSLAQQGCYVNLVGYTDTLPHRNVVGEYIRFIPLPKPPISSSYVNPIVSFLVRLIKMIWLLFVLPYTFFLHCRGPSHRQMIMVQNPPGIPAMIVCYLMAKIQFAAFVVDWHNYSSSMLGRTWPAYFVGLIEGFFGRRATLNFCVSNAMKNDLERRWAVRATTLYDRPPTWISEGLVSPVEKVRIFHRLATEHLRDLNDEWKFTHEEADGTLKFREKRPLLLVSSTSWTPDEDFSILLDALIRLDKRVADIADNQALGPAITYPNIVVVITGKGPLKEFYEERIRQFCWKNVRVFTAWLPANDYPTFLACADVGVSLHTSTSGFDLPMKVVDMFGSGLPVLAKNFPAISELVEDGRNGLLFDTAEELEGLLADISLGFPENPKLSELSKMVKEHSKNNHWVRNWNAVFWPRVEHF
uniref:Chitobiosyldiphosphodolichol beta-mannosyltransferase n=1 Tax=Globodera rostochiensis TaxID=31243 RepID=A0A914H5B3_GLORO